MRRQLTILVSLILLLSYAVVSMAASEYDIPRHVFSSGGGQTSGGDFSLDVTFGQPVVGSIEGGGYSVCTGFHCGAATTTPTATPTLTATPTIPLYLPLLQNRSI